MDTKVIVFLAAIAHVMAAPANLMGSSHHVSPSGAPSSSSAHTRRQPRPFPIFDNSPFTSTLFGGGVTTPDIHHTFPNFLLPPWSFLLPVIPGVSGGAIFNRDNLIPLLETTDAAHGSTIGWYVLNPFAPDEAAAPAAAAGHGKNLQETGNAVKQDLTVLDPHNRDALQGPDSAPQSPIDPFSLYFNELLQRQQIPPTPLFSAPPFGNYYLVAMQQTPSENTTSLSVPNSTPSSASTSPQVDTPHPDVEVPATNKMF